MKGRGILAMWLQRGVGVSRRRVMGTNRNRKRRTSPRVVTNLLRLRQWRVGSRRRRCRLWTD